MSTHKKFTVSCDERILAGIKSEFSDEEIERMLFEVAATHGVVPSEVCIETREYRPLNFIECRWE